MLFMECTEKECEPDCRKCKKRIKHSNTILQKIQVTFKILSSVVLLLQLQKEDIFQELGYLKVACFSHVRYNGVLLWNELIAGCLIVVMWFGALSFLGARMRTYGLVHPLFVPWFEIPDFSYAKGWQVEHGVEDHEARDSNDVQVGLRLVVEPM